MRSVEDLVKETKKLPYSSIGKDLTIAEAIRVWNAAGDFIYHNLLQNRIILVPNIGKFVVQEEKIPIAHNPPRYICRRSPTFQLSSKLAMHFRMRRSSNNPCGSHPEISLNFSTISYMCQMSRSKVDMCIKEIVASVYLDLGAISKVELPFVGVGVLFLEEETSKFIFEKKLVENVK